MELWKYSTEVSFREFDWLYLFWGRVVSTVEYESMDVSEEEEESLGARAKGKLGIRDLRRVFFESRFYRILWYSMSSRR
ncbi:unnamed protein product [Trifolium pratense]|uniref:Uncharacterized protein n=1 Tax=Trifolium pratense TaxID=57577 RepID=A0ACB0MFJ3_TRIPR|nr:unnamed protein product [Trifolium pratense]